MKSMLILTYIRVFSEQIFRQSVAAEAPCHWYLFSTFL